MFISYIKQFAGALMMINTYNVKKKIACTTPSHPKSEPLKQSQDLDTPWAEIFFKSFPYLMFIMINMGMFDSSPKHECLMLQARYSSEYFVL